METWQKVLIGVLALALIGTGVFGYLQTRKVNEGLEQIKVLEQTVAALNQEDNVAILAVSEPVKSGTLFDPTKINVISIPRKFDSDAYVKNANLLKDSIWRINLEANAILTTDMLALEPVYPTDRYHLLLVDAVTPSTMTGDFVDLRMVTTDGIDFVVLAKKRITNMYTSGIETILSETELMIYGGYLIDRAMHRGTVAYASKYVDPTLQNKMYTTYIPPQEIVDWMNMNPNMIFPYLDDGDISAMRTYIESVQPYNKYRDTQFDSIVQEIRNKEDRIGSSWASQMGAMRQARAQFIEYMKNKAEAEGTTFNYTNVGESQVSAADVQAGDISAGAQRDTSINSDGTYVDSNGVRRKADGTPIIEAGDIVTGDNDDVEEAPMDDGESTIVVPNINGGE